MDPIEDFDFPTLLHRLRSFHFKWELLKEERDALRTSLNEANSKIAQLEATVAKYKTKEMIIEKERYILSHVIQSLHEEVIEEKTLSKKIDQIEENVTALEAVIENSLCDDNRDAPSLSSNIHEPESHETENNSDQDILIRNNLLNDKSEEIDEDFFNDSESSFTACFDETSKSPSPSETSVAKEENEIPIETTPTFLPLPSLSDSYKIAVSIMDNLDETKPKIRECKVILPDFTSSLSQLRPGYSYERAKLFHRSFSHNEISSAIATSPEISFQEAIEQIEVIEVGEVCVSNSPNEQNQADDTSPSNNEIGEMFSGNPMLTIDTSKESPDDSSFDVIKTNLHDVQESSDQNVSIKLEKISDSGYDGDQITRPVQRSSQPYNLRKRKSISSAKKDKSSHIGEEVASDFAKRQFSSEIATLSPNSLMSNKINLFMKQCLICKKENQNDPAPQFVTYHQLDQHILENHPEPSPTYNRCPYVEKNCIRHFKYMAHLRLHINKWHQTANSESSSKDYFFQPKIRPNYSSEKKKPFVNDSDFKYRVKRKDSRSVVLAKLPRTKITCEICEYVAYSSKMMIIHKLKYHRIRSPQKT